MEIDRENNVKNQRAVDALLKELRLRSGLRQIDVAVRLGIQQSIVSKYEVGERRLDILEIRTLCSLFGISLENFASELERRLEATNEGD